MVLLLMWMGLIFYLSAQPAGESTETSNAAALILYRMCSFFFGNIISTEEFMLRYAQPIRKLAHFTEFLILGFLMHLNLDGHERTFGHSICLSVLYAISDEFHQLFVENRYCSIGDILIDSSGAVCGVLLFHLIFGKWKKRN